MHKEFLLDSQTEVLTIYRPMNCFMYYPGKVMQFVDIMEFKEGEWNRRHEWRDSTFEEAAMVALKAAFGEMLKDIPVAGHA